MVADRDNVQHGIQDEHGKEAECEQDKTTDIDETSPGEDVAVALVLVVGIRIVQIVVLLDVFGEQEQAGRGQDVELFRDGLRVQVVVAAGARRRSRVVKGRGKGPSRVAGDV